MEFLNLIRYKNLLIMAGTMVMVKFCIINPITGLFNMEPTFLGLDFVFLTLALLLVAAGGYVINDYFDTKTDRINRPDSQIVGNSVTHGTATTWHIALSAAGCVLGMLVSLRVGLWQLGLIYPFAVGLLWFYSSAYKGMFLVGNLVVSLLVGIVPMVPALYEVRGLIQVDNPAITMGAFDPFVIIYWSVGYAVFAFVINLIREIIKDMEDQEGDMMQGCNTMPIVLGPAATKAIISVLIVAAMGGLVYAYLEFLNETKSAIYIGALMILPLAFLLYKVIRISDKNDCHLCSTITKVIMLLGVLYMFIVRYNFLVFKEEF